MWKHLLLVFLAFCTAGRSETKPPSINFRADFYERDFANNTTSIKGNAVVKKSDQTLRADVMEIDFNRELVTARGNVQFSQGDLTIWADYANYNTATEEAVLENAILSVGTAVLTGKQIQRRSRTRYQIEEGSYTNCNIDLKTGRELSECKYDWKLQGRKLDITLGAYAHIHDAIGFIQRVPFLYAPYFVVPIKTERQTGLLFPSLGYNDTLGTTLGLPFFWAIGRSHDLTFSPSWHTRRGYHFGTQYRYNYSPRTNGELNLFGIQRRFQSNRANPAPEDASQKRLFGFVGEGGIRLQQQIGFGERMHSRQSILYVTDPYYVVDYGGDVASGEMASLRSQASLTVPGDKDLFTALVQHHQRLSIPVDTGIDRGPISKLPSLNYSRVSSHLGTSLFQYEFDLSAEHFWRRGRADDSVPATFNPNVSIPLVHSDPNQNYHSGNYIREGVRLRAEPRLITSIPLNPGIQLQPTLKAPISLYRFTLPSDEWFYRNSLEFELPASFYFARTFDTNIDGARKIQHVIQPRITYGLTLFQGGQSESEHPFFFEDTSRSLSNPRFDLDDQFLNLEFLRLELIQRFRRQTPSGAQRFILLSLAQQYNSRVSAMDPRSRFQRRIGPIEILSELDIWRFRAQFEGKIQLEKTLNSVGERIRENDLSSSLEYLSPNGDSVRLATRFKIRADDSITEKTGTLDWYKTLPLFFDVKGGLEYSWKRGRLVRYELGVVVASKPRRCWHLELSFGQDERKQSFGRFNFQLDLDTQS